MGFIAAKSYRKVQGGAEGQLLIDLVRDVRQRGCDVSRSYSGQVAVLREKYLYFSGPTVSSGRNKTSFCIYHVSQYYFTHSTSNNLLQKLVYYNLLQVLIIIHLRLNARDVIGYPRATVIVIHNG